MVIFINNKKCNAGENCFRENLFKHFYCFQWGLDKLGAQ